MPLKSITNQPLDLSRHAYQLNTWTKQIISPAPFPANSVKQVSNPFDEIWKILQQRWNPTDKAPFTLG